ncbi:hypothetical protein B0H13DRAFT_1900229 [Mycena leptocephala]|nr:hypothetical protein B0H13DRAFT_1900229 [Mycena leptocephala]
MSTHTLKHLELRHGRKIGLEHHAQHIFLVDSDNVSAHLHSRSPAERELRASALQNKIEGIQRSLERFEASKLERLELHGEIDTRHGVLDDGVSAHVYYVFDCARDISQAGRKEGKGGEEGGSDEKGEGREDGLGWWEGKRGARRGIIRKQREGWRNEGERAREGKQRGGGNGRGRGRATGIDSENVGKDGGTRQCGGTRGEAPGWTGHKTVALALRLRAKRRRDEKGREEWVRKREETRTPPRRYQCNPPREAEAEVENGFDTVIPPVAVDFGHIAGMQYFLGTAKV